MSETASRETHGFQTEVTQLLKLMVHSLYGNKEIFLRELVSNASDACDKLRFEALTDASLLGDDTELTIHVDDDESARTVTVRDNGIGMSRQEVIDNIGTIAKSGTQEFFQSLTGDQARDAHLIGQFGVGFYSSFVVADEVTVITRRAGAPPEGAVRWQSRGEADYSLETTTKESRGTDVILHLREGEDEFLAVWRLREILRKYSDHITLPILMRGEASKDAAAPPTIEQVNQASALWARPKSEITEEQYHEFYKHVAHDFDPPLAYVHAKVEGRQEYTQLLFIPQHAPFDLWDRKPRHGVKLYVRRVFIMEDAEQLMPLYLRFVRGVIDSSDLPLNVSREILQHSKDVEAIRNASVKRVLSLLEDLSEKDPDKYATFWNEFGRVVKEGVGEDLANRDRLGKLLRFSTTKTDQDDQTVSLPEYVARMKEGQSKIYYITADSFAAARNSPHLEVFRKKDLEVLLLHDRVDEWVVANLSEFDGTPLQSVAKGDLDLGDLVETPDSVSRTEEWQPVARRIAEVLGPRAQEVRISDRLTDSAACLVSEEGGMSMNLERLLKAAGQAVPGVQPILEINPDHPLVRRLRDETDDRRFADWSHVLFDQALLAEGGQLEDPAAFVKRLNDLMLTLGGEGGSRIWTPN